MESGQALIQNNEDLKANQAPPTSGPGEEQIESTDDFGGENLTRDANEAIDDSEIEPATSAPTSREGENITKDETGNKDESEIEAMILAPEPDKGENSTTDDTRINYDVKAGEGEISIKDDLETNGDLEIEPTRLADGAVEGENSNHDLKIDLFTPAPMANDSENSNISPCLDRLLSSSSSSSSPSSSSSSNSSSEDCFRTGENEACDTPLVLAEDDHNGLVPSQPETSQTLSNTRHETASVDTIGSVEIPSKTSEEVDNFDNFVSQPPSKVTFQMTKEHENLRAVTEPSSSPIQEWRGGHELAGPLSKPAMPGYTNSTTLVTQFPPTQTMERPNNDTVSSSGYRIPSSVFSRTKSSQPTEWSTASNESLFSIHMGNASFNRDMLFWVGKSGELGMSNPFLDLSSSTNPPPMMSNKPAHTSHSSANSDEDFRVAEAKAAETMREVIRENDEDRAKEEAAAIAKSKEVQPSAKISRNPDEKTKSFAFPVLTGDGDKSGSSKKGAAKQAQQSRSRTPNSTPVVTADNSRANRIMGQYRWFSYPCFTCCRSPCY